MAKSSTTFGEKNQPSTRRGRSKRTLILEAIKETSLVGTSKDSTPEEVEVAFFKHVAERATNAEDNNSGMCLKLLADKGWASVKPSSECVSFDFDDKAEPHEQAAQVVKAASKGLIPPDIANTFVSSIKSMIDIHEYTELKQRIEKLEAVLDSK